MASGARASRPLSEIAALSRACAGGTPAPQELIDLLVGEPLAAANGGGIEFGRNAQPFVGELHHGRFRVANLARLKTRQAVRDHLGQHRQHAVGQIDARGALERLAVQRGFRPNEMRHVGNVNPQPPMAVLQPLQRNGVVEIAGVDRIDRHDRLAGEILAAADRFVERLGLAVGLLDRVFGEAVGQVELADDRKRIDARLCRAGRALRR